MDKKPLHSPFPTPVSGVAYWIALRIGGRNPPTKISHTMLDRFSLINSADIVESIVSFLSNHLNTWGQPKTSAI
jgi:hypothetical protein